MTKVKPHKHEFKLAPHGKKLNPPWFETAAVHYDDGKAYRVWAKNPAMYARNYDPIDALGGVNARIAELEVQADALKDALRACGAGAYEGALFRASVGEDGVQTKRDAAAMADKLRFEGFHAFAAAHEEEVPKKGSVRVVSRTGKEVKRAA